MNQYRNNTKLRETVEKIEEDKHIYNWPYGFHRTDKVKIEILPDVTVETELVWKVDPKDTTHFIGVMFGNNTMWLHQINENDEVNTGYFQLITGLNVWDTPLELTGCEIPGLLDYFIELTINKLPDRKQT